MKSIEVKNNTYIDSIKKVNDEDPKFNPQSAQCLLKTLKKMQATSLYWFAAQQQNRTLRPQKLACFALKLMQNLANLVFF